MTAASDPPSADSARQAIHSIRGYEYQVLAATLAWVELDENGLLYLEVAEDYAKVVHSAIEAVQVKDTRSSGSVTLNTPAVRAAIESFVDLTERNPDRQIQFRFFTTSRIGVEHASRDRPGGLAGLTYWQRVRARREDLGPLRAILERESYPKAVRTFCKRRSDEKLTTDLIRRITWDCNRPETTTLRQELEQRLARLLRKEFGIASQEASRVADTLVFRVLQRSAMPDAQDRVLSRSELHGLVDFSTRLSLPRALVEKLLRLALANGPQSSPGQTIVCAQGRDSPPWVIDASRVPAPKVLIPRHAVESAVQSALESTGICFIVGPTGTGKSMIARTVASKFSCGAHWIDLRDADSRKARSRLEQVLALLAGMGPSTLMVEDLNCIVAPPVQLSLAKIVEAARRHDMRVMITCYLQPSMTVLNGLGADAESIVACPHFDQEETNALVKRLGGEPAIWGRIAHVTGGAGHPQLTHAFIAGMAAKGWPADAIGQVVNRGFTSDDLEDVRNAARGSLIESLGEPARDLLYRLSITIDPFERSLALAIGALPPSIQRAGECFDELVGRWVEAAPSGRYRVLPLVRGFGRKMLAEEEQRKIHHTIAAQTISHGPIDAGDIETILLHGLAGESQESLVKLSRAINVADDETRQALATHLAVFGLLDTSRPIYPKHLLTSVMLRLAQLRLVAASDERDGIEDIVRALLLETDSVPLDLAGPYLESAVIDSILGNLGIANHLRSWVELLSRSYRLERADDERALSPHPEIPKGAVLFGIGIAGLDSVEKLEAIFEDLCALAQDERRELLTPINPSDANYHLLVHGPLIAQSRDPEFDAVEAVASYERMARRTEELGEHTLSLQCHVAVAMILDEHLGDVQSALRVLKDAETSFGEDSVLARAFARLHHRNGRRAEALAFYRDAVSHLGGFAPVDAICTVRDAAICAAECGDWNTARTWFLRAHAASEPLLIIEGGSIGIGLSVDTAVASLKTGDLGEALGLLKDALLALAEIDPNSSLQAAHCHRLVRHTILWLKSKVLRLDTKIQGEPIAILPGSCSNPEPVPEIQQLPLAHIDFAWYMLAEIELAARLDLGIREVVTQMTARGQIPLSELDLRLQTLGADVERLDPTSFSKHLLDYVASSAYCYVNRSRLGESFDAIDPERAIIPAVSVEGSFDPYTEHTARHAILAYGVRSLLNGRRNAIFELRDGLTARLEHSYPGKFLFDNWNSLDADAGDLDDEVAVILALCLDSDRPPPGLLFRAGLRLLDWITQSVFKPVLISQLTPWLKHQWLRVLQTQRFLLFAPASTVPAIEDVLQSHSTGERFAARLILVTAAGVQARLGGELRERLSQMANGSHE